MASLKQKIADRWRRWQMPVAMPQSLTSVFLPEIPPLDLRIVSRMLVHASIVGLVAGLAGVLFFYALELLQWLLLERLAGYTVLRAAGEHAIFEGGLWSFTPWLLILVPAVGGLASGLISHFAPETRGGGADAIISSFHHQGGVVRKRVIGLKALASLFTLGTGGSGGREGPTMQIGGAFGSLVGQVLHLTVRERRILLVAGIAAGISAVFRTPLGAALLAVEVLYRDGFESDALVPAVFASVVAYSISISITGESTLFSCGGEFPFHPEQLPLYAVLAVVVSAFATVFLSLFRKIRNAFSRLPVPLWLRPGIGGLLLGLFCMPFIYWAGRQIGTPGVGVGLLGGGYGEVQVAISGAAWLPDGWTAVALLAGFALAKMIATSFTIGSGGSAGDFAPSLAIGALVGGAFGRMAQLVLSDPSIDPAAFALVGMGVFYGGLAHVPLAAVILVCELANSYDLLVPLMLAQGIAFVLLRTRSLYDAQVNDQVHSPAHRSDSPFEGFGNIRVVEAVSQSRLFAVFHPSDPIVKIVSRSREFEDQEVFPVQNDSGVIVGIITWSAVTAGASNAEFMPWLIAMDIMQPHVSVTEDSELSRAVTVMAANQIREIPVVNTSGQVVSLLNQEDVVRSYAAQVLKTSREHT